MAGLDAGETFELGPGRWTFAPAGHAGFTLGVGDGPGSERVIAVEPVDLPVRVGDEVVFESTVFAMSELRGRMIDAGSAGFALEPLPRLDGRGGGGPLGPVPIEWVTDPVPCPGPVGDRLIDLAAARARLHHGPCDTRARIEGAARRWSDRPGDALFGIVMVGLVDMRVPARSDGGSTGPKGRVAPSGSVSVPVSVDLLGSDTVIAGPRCHQLAVVRHLVLAAAASVAPHHLRIVIETDRPELAFLDRLPHAQRPMGPVDRSTLIVIDRDHRTPQPDEARASELGGDRSSALRDRRWPPMLGPGARLMIGRPADPVPERADIVSVVEAQTVSVDCCNPARLVRRALPIGLAESTARALVDRLAAQG